MGTRVPRSLLDKREAPSKRGNKRHDLSVWRAPRGKAPKDAFAARAFRSAA